MFDSRVVEPGPPPILTDWGIVLIYNGADDNLVYRTAVAVFDRRDPRKLISRSDAPSLLRKRNGRRPAKCRTSSLLRGWSQRAVRKTSLAAGITFSSIMVPPTNTSVLLKPG